MMVNPLLQFSETADAFQFTDVMLLAHCTMGLVAAQWAQRKGFDLGQWILLGTLGGTAALVWISRMPPRRQG